MTPFENGPSKESRHGFTERLIEFVYILILFATVGGWFFAGFVVWVPLLVRSTTLLTAAVFYATLFRDPDRITNTERNLYFAVRFYVRGFEHFVTFYRQRHAPEPPPGMLETLSEMKWRELLIECIWVVGVWAVVFFIAHGIIAAILTIAVGAHDVHPS